MNWPDASDFATRPPAALQAALIFKPQFIWATGQPAEQLMLYKSSLFCFPQVCLDASSSEMGNNLD
jgi:hypothetical protein